MLIEELAMSLIECKVVYLNEQLSCVAALVKKFVLTPHTGHTCRV